MSLYKDLRFPKEAKQFAPLRVPKPRRRMSRESAKSPCGRNLAILRMAYASGARFVAEWRNQGMRLCARCCLPAHAATRSHEDPQRKLRNTLPRTADVFLYRSRLERATGKRTRPQCQTGPNGSRHRRGRPKP